MARGVGGEGGARGGRDPKGGSSGGRSGGGNSGGGERGTASQQQDRRNQANARAAGNTAPGVRGGSSVSDQRHRNRLAEIERIAKATGTSPAPVGNTGVSPAGRVSSAYQGMSRDYRDVGNSTMENLGNRLASALGFNQQRPTPQMAAEHVNQTPTGQVTDRRAGWGFDPAGLIGGAIGMAAGVPFGTGFLADQVSKRFGRPMEIGMGPSVFGGGYSPFGGGVNTASGPSGSLRQGGGNGGQFASAQPAPRRTPTAPSIPGASWGPPPTRTPNLNAPQMNYSPFAPSTRQWSWG